jgi:lipoprotein signal peptidase
MRPATQRIYWLLLPIAALVLLDEWLKVLSLQRLPAEGSLVDPGLIEFAIHKNYGIAFNIPFKLEIVLIISVFIGIGLIQVAYKHWKDKPAIAFSALMVVIGALGNMYDRFVYDFTVDYIILFGTSAINLSDLVIVSGALLLLLTSREKKPKRHKVDTSSDA